MPAESAPHGYAFLDSGHGRRLERFASAAVVRPAPAAAWAPALPSSAWNRPDLEFTRAAGWRGDAPAGWRVAFGPAVLGLRPSPGGGLGTFPEHAIAAARLEAALAGRPAAPGSLRVLNLFAHTGLLTLRLAADAKTGETVHVDASGGAVRRARENADMSGLGEKRIRWLVDDAPAFMEREARRDRTYDLVAADPPAYGRGGKAGGAWRLDRDLPRLLANAGRLLAPGGILCLTCHSEGWTADTAAAAVREHIPGLERADTAALTLSPASRGMALPAGFSVIVRRRGGG